MANTGMIDLDLTTLGNLNAEVRDMLTQLIQSIPTDDPVSVGRLTIRIAVKRVFDTSSLVNIAYAVQPTFPKKASAILARADLVGNLSVDPDDLPDRTPHLPGFISTETVTENVKEA